MSLESLHLVEGTQVRVPVVEAHHEADGQLVVFQMVNEGSAVSGPVQGPAHSVDDLSRLVLRRIDLPQLLDADAVGLRIDALAEIESLEQRLGQRATATLGKDRLPGEKLYTRLEARLVLAVDSNAHVAGGDATDRACLVVQHLGGGKARENFDAEILGLLTQPTAQVTETDDVVSLVVHLRRRRQAHGALAGQEQEAVFANWCLERRTELFPIRQQLDERTRFQHGAGQDMSADLGTLLDDAHAQVGALALG